MVERSEPPPHALPRSRIQLPRGPTHTIRTAAACSTFLSNVFFCISRRTARACRSNTMPRPTAWRGRFLFRTWRSRGPLWRSTYNPSAGVEPQSAAPHSNCTRIRSNCVRLGTHALSLHPPLRAQMSAARGACGRAELALRRRCVGCPSGGAAPRAKGLSGRGLRPAGARPASSSRPPTRRARSGSRSSVQALGHVGLGLGAPAGTRGPSPIPAAGPKRASTRPARLHKDFPKKF
jgi:hypothetical protein